MEHHETAALSEAEQEIMHWLAQGKTNMQIAHLRGRSAATVRNQLHSVFRKLGVETRTQAVAHWLVINQLASKSSDAGRTDVPLPRREGSQTIDALRTLAIPGIREPI